LGLDGFSFEIGGRFRALLMLARAAAAELEPAVVRKLLTKDLAIIDEPA